MVANISKKHTESELVLQCKNRDRKGQKELYEEQAPFMLAVCRRYISDNDLAEEQMLKGFMKVFEKIDQFKSEGSFQGWMKRIMVTTCLEWIRKNKQMYREVDLDSISHPLDLVSMEEHLEAEDLMKLVYQLPQGYRTIFNLYAIEGYNHNEIAKSLSISVNTSKSQLSRARKLLQKMLSETEKYFKSNQKDNGS